MKYTRKSKKPKKQLAERLAESPAIALEMFVESADKATKRIKNDKVVKKTNEYWESLGPGLTTGASDDDPSGIATYSQAGAIYGFRFLWLSIVTFPLMSVVQEMCARIGLVTGRGLAGNIRLHFSRRVMLACAWLLLLANTFNIGANLGAMAKATQLLFPSLAFGTLVIGFAVFSLSIQVFSDYIRNARYLKWLALVLFAYVFSALLANIDWGFVLRQAITPKMSFDKSELIMICAILGTTISPYLFFWQTSQEVEDKIAKGKSLLKNRRGSNKLEVWNMRKDVWSGMFLSNLVMFFIIASSAAVLNANGITEITSAAQAAEALRPFAGNASYLLFTIGIVGTGLLSIPVLAGASSYALSEAFHWKEGLSLPLNQAHAFYGIIIISIVAGAGINFLGIDTIKALIYAAVANGLVAPVILALIVLIASNKKIMGRWVNRPFTTFIGWLTVGLMSLAGLAAIYALV